MFVILFWMAPQTIMKQRQIALVENKDISDCCVRGGGGGGGGHFSWRPYQMLERNTWGKGYPIQGWARIAKRVSTSEKAWGRVSKSL